MKNKAKALTSVLIALSSMFSVEDDLVIINNRSWRTIDKWNYNLIYQQCLFLEERVEFLKEKDRWKLVPLDVRITIAAILKEFNLLKMSTEETYLKN